MERHVLSVMPDRSGWVLVDGGQQVERFRTRQGAIAIGEVKAYKLFQLTGIPSALAVFMDDTTSKTEVQFGRGDSRKATPAGVAFRLVPKVGQIGGAACRERVVQSG